MKTPKADSDEVVKDAISNRVAGYRRVDCETGDIYDKGSAGERTYIFHEDGQQTMFTAHEHEFTQEQLEQQRAATEEHDIKYSGLSHEEMLYKMGEELREQIEAPLRNDAFEVSYLVDVSVNDKLDIQANLFIEAVNSHKPEPDAPDTLTVSVRYPKGNGKVKLTPKDGIETVFDINVATLPSVKVKMFPIKNGISFQSGERTIRLGIGSTPYAKKLYEAVEARNARFGWTPPQTRAAHEIAVPLAETEYSIHTSQEIDAITRARCDGKTFAFYVQNPQAGAITYERKELPHRVQLALTSDERDAGLSVGYLEKLVRSQDSDAALAHLYVMRVLAPPAPLPQRSYAGGWVDFDDVIEKIGWYPQTTKARREMHARIWEFLKFGERAHIIGKRIGVYKDPSTGKELSTEMHGAAWRILKTEQPKAQGSLYPALDVPVRAEIVMSQELTALVTSSLTAQYLPMGEVLGAIPGGKPAGAWARVIGMALISFWRRNPRETQNDTLRPTRRELLSHYAAKLAPYEEVLESSDPQRAIVYWCGAMGILADAQFIAREGEALRTAKQIKDAFPRKGWQDTWLNETVDIRPAQGTMKNAIEERAKALPAHKPHDLKNNKNARKTRKSQ